MRQLNLYFLAMLMAMLLIPETTLAQEAKLSEKAEELQTEMYRLFYKDDSLQFYQVIQQLKDECQKEGNEQVFYKAWGNHAIYESTHQRRTHALEIAREMEKYAKEHHSTYGQYTAIHVMGSVYHQMRDYGNAEENFQRAADFLHEHAPSESAAADYLELTLIAANGYSNEEKAVAYAKRTLEEPNISMQHRLRALTMLCQITGDKLNPDREEFNKYYELRLQTRQSTVGDKAERVVNWLYEYVNGNYEKALALADSLSPDQGTFAKARIYHKMGKDDKAFEQMLAYKHANDSTNRAERKGLLSEYIVQLSNERLELEKKELEAQYRSLRNTIIFSVIALFVALLIVGTYYVVKHLRARNAMLGAAHQQEKRARIAEQEARVEAEKEIEVKRKFMSNIAKELRSPLNPITGFSDILAATDIELQAEEREMMSQLIKENSKQLSDIIDRMVEFSFYESTQSLPKDDVFSPNVLCQNAYDFARMHQVKEGVEIDFKTELPDTLTVKSDFQGVDKVVRELLYNATKYTDHGNILLYCDEHDDRVRFIISDTGEGISPEHARHIFEPFVQSGEHVKATGMGLAICNRIAKLLNGTLTLDASSKNGSRFIFEIDKA